MLRDTIDPKALGSEIDPITLEVLKNALASVADEMALVIMRSAYSPVVRDTMDYSTALCDRNGEVIAQGLTLAIQLGTFPSVMSHVLAEYGDTAQPGDLYITNDPYGFGGQHLPDIYIIMPIFHDGVLEGYAATMAHHSDVGGIAPGSVAVYATEIYQEGLRIPLIRLQQGTEDESFLFRLIEKNTRQPVEVIGDLHAQISACRAAERGLTEIAERYGSATLRLYTDELQRQAERLMRAEIEALPDGKYSFEDFVDGIGDEPQPIRICVEVTVAGDEVHMDFEGTSPQVPAAVNAPIAIVYAACYCAIRSIAKHELPNAQGYMKPIHISAPERSVVNPAPPAACGARGVMGYRVFDAIMGALAAVVPEKVVAAGEGGPSLIAIGGYDDTGKPFVLMEVIVGCWGARAALEGLEGVSNPLANLSNQPVELIETDLPLVVTQYGLAPDTGGAGTFRGGLAYVREYQLLTEQAVLTVRSDRRAHPPYGLDGGCSGAPSANSIISNGQPDRILPTMPMGPVALRRGDIFRHQSAGGGGYGDSLARDPQRVLDDVLDDKVTVAAARSEYGVVIAGDGPARFVDVELTAQLRSARH